MKLSDKGRYAPPPSLPKHAQAVSEAIASWPEVHARTHWLLGDENVVDGADFYLGDEEIGHIHLDGEAHVAVSASIRRALVDSGLAEPFEWSRSFVVTSIRRERDVEHAKALFRIAYERRRGAKEEELLERALAMGAPSAEPR